VNKVNPKKLLHSKWTAVTPQNKEKHFVVIDVEFDEDTTEVVSCVMQAIMTKREFNLDWRTLKLSNDWLSGWK